MARIRALNARAHSDVTSPVESGTLPGTASAAASAAAPGGMHVGEPPHDVAQTYPCNVQSEVLLHDCWHTRPKVVQPPSPASDVA